MLSHRFTLPEHVSISSRYFTENVSETSTTTTCRSSISPALSYQSVLVSGPLGSLSFTCPPSFSYDLSDHPSLLVEAPSSFSPILFRSFISLFSNSITGVSNGFKLTLSLSGVGFKASNQGNVLELSLGYSHNIFFAVPDEVKVTTLTEKGKNPIVTLESTDKQLIGHVAAKIRELRKIEPYKGKGVKFVGEIIRRKAGKAAAK